MDYEDAINRIFTSSKDELENIKKLNDEAQKLIDNNEANEKTWTTSPSRWKKPFKDRRTHMHSRNEFYEKITSRKNRMELMEQFEDYLEEKLKEYGLQSDEEEEE